MALLVVVAIAATLRAEAPSASASAAAPELPLQPLPTLAPLERPAPKPDAVQNLDTRLEQLLSTRVAHPVQPRVDFAFLTTNLDADIVPAIAQRLEQLRRSLDGHGASQHLERARKEGSKALPASKKADKKKSDVEGDWLQFVLALRKHESESWKGLAQIYAMLRMLEAVGTTEAAREMIHCYGYFGELVRIDLQRAIERLKDKAVPALIEAREHDAKKVRDWARRQLESIGRAIPGEAVSTTDPQVLADVLIAFGRVRDVDAARVVLSFVASDRVQLRNAARASIAAIGEPAMWHLKDGYENVTGEKPPRAWDFKRLLQELFRLHDRARLSNVYELLDQGAAAAKKGDVAGAVGFYDQLLARAPLFERRKEIAPTYVAHARELEKAGRSDEALVALRKALRLDPDAADRKKIESRANYLEGKTLADRGTADPFILQRAVELDPENEDARSLLASLEARATVQRERTKRHAAAIAIGVVALVAMIWLLRRREPRSPVNSAEGDGAAQQS
jgi:tetratricopeptide (TPR) repeat protein